jgi:predicted ferric reductase
MKRLTLGALAGFLLVFPIVVWASYSAWPPTWPLLLYQLSQVCALIGFNLLTFQFLLASRMPILEMGLGQDRLFQVHRAFGIAGFGFVALHGLAYTTWELIARGSISVSLLKLAGVLGLTLTALIAVVAMYHDRFGMKYETWKNIHRLTFLILPMVFVHSLLLGSTIISSQAVRIQWFVLVGLYGVVVVYRASILIYIRNHPFKVSAVRQESHDTWTVEFDGPKPRYLPGQFMFVNLVRNGTVSESHPFTISSSPTADIMSITPKAIGDFTSTIRHTAIGDQAYIEAPFGVFSYTNSDAQRLAFIAGGIGITPFLSMLRHMRDTNTKRDVVLIWGNKTEDDIMFVDELRDMVRSFDKFTMHHVLSHGEWEGKSGLSGDTGFVDGDKVRQYLGTPTDYEIYVCGPPIMMTKLIPAIKSLGVPPGQIRSERFAV